MYLVIVQEEDISSLQDFITTTGPQNISAIFAQFSGVKLFADNEISSTLKVKGIPCFCCINSLRANNIDDNSIENCNPASLGILHELCEEPSNVHVIGVLPG